MNDLRTGPGISSERVLSDTAGRVFSCGDGVFGGGWPTVKPSLVAGFISHVIKCDPTRLAPLQRTHEHARMTLGTQHPYRRPTPTFWYNLDLCSDF